MVECDEKFVRDTIQKLPSVKLKQVAWQSYQRVYKQSFNDEPLDYKKENVARRTANTALRNYVNRVIKIGIN